MQYCVYSPSENYEEHFEKYHWCKDNTAGYSILYPLNQTLHGWHKLADWYFADEADAVLFRLKYGK